MKNTLSVAALLGLLLGLLAGGTAAAADAQLGVSAVVLPHCQFTSAADTTVDCRRGVAWTVAVTTVDRVRVKQIYF